MKKMLYIAVVCAISLSSSLFAALGPLAQNTREIKAILSHPEFDKKLDSSDTIKTIKHKGDSYIVRTEDVQMIVDVVYEKQPQAGSQRQVGPIKFTLVFHNPTPIE